MLAGLVEVRRRQKKTIEKEKRMLNKVTYTSTALLLALSVSSVFGATSDRQNKSYLGAVFLMTNSNTGNQILRFGRQANGTLVSLGSTPTGGRGSGGTVDPLGSQNSLLLTQDSGFLLAVNSASGTISSFQVDGANLQLVDIKSSGGTAPGAIAQWGNLVYVLNQAGNASVVGFHLEDGRLIRIPNATSYLTTGLSGGSSVTFTSDGKVLLAAERVTGKIDAFPVNADGTLGTANITAYPGIFDFAIAPSSGLLISVGGPNIGSSLVDDSATVTSLALTPIFKGACWVVVTANGFAYASTGGPDIIDGYSVTSSGVFTPIGTGEAATVATGALLDLALSDDGKYLYANNGGNGTVDIWTINADGSLKAQTPVTLPAGSAGTGFNGIAAY